MLFDETVKWKILYKYFERPEKEYFVKELARELKIGAGSASRVCKELEKEGLLEANEKGRALFYSLKNDDPLVKRIKSAWFLNNLLKFKSSWENEAFFSVALYGSRASGEFISESDVDFLVVSNVKLIELEKLKKKFKLTLTVFTVADWREMAKKKDRFYIEVLSNHILLYGSPLVVG